MDDWIDVLLRRADILTRSARTAVLRVTADHTKWLCVNAEEYTELWSSLFGRWVAYMVLSHAVDLHSRMVAVARLVVERAARGARGL